MGHQISSTSWKNLEELNSQIYDTSIGELPPAGHWSQPGWFGARRKVMFIGQNPGMMTKSDEPWKHDRDQEVYLWAIKRSPTGEMISKAIEKAGLTWDDVSYTNVVKSPTPGNRVPTEEEIEYYKPMLFEQIDLYKPRKIVVFGAITRKALNPSLKKNIVYNYKVSILCIDHPSYVIYSNNEVEYISRIVNFIKE